MHEKAKLLDDLIDEYIKTKDSGFVPMNNLKQIVVMIFPNAFMVNLGMHKLVFCLRHKSHELALKIGKKQSIERDHQAYKQLPKNIRHVYFVRVFGHTKYCLLQDYGEKANVSTEELAQLRAIAGKYGLLDISCENIRSVNGDLKIIDAGIAPPRIFRLWKTTDFITLRLPPSVRRALRKSRLLNTVRGR